MTTKKMMIMLGVVALVFIALPVMDVAFGQDAISWGETVSQPVADDGSSSSVGKWLPYVLMGVLVFVLLIIFVILLVVIMVSSKGRQRKHQEELARTAAERDERDRQIQEQQQQIQNLLHQMDSMADSEPMEDPDEGKTMVIGKAKLGVVLIDKSTGVTHPLAMHKANPDGHVTQTPTYTIGRDKDCDIVLPETTISKHHCDLYANYEGDIFIYDHNSANGTCVERGAESIRVEGKQKLQNEDVLIIGDKRAGAAKLRVIIEEFD